MSRIQVDNIFDKEGTGAPLFPKGAVVTGVVTATSFSGDGSTLTGIDATSLKDGNGAVRVQANTSGANVTGIITATLVSATTVSSTNVSASSSITADDVFATSDVSSVNVSASSSVTASDFYGNGSNLSGVESGVANFVATGTIPNGATVVIKDDGTVGIVTGTVAQTPTAGDIVTWSSVNTSQIASTYDSSNNKLVIAYVDNTNSGHGKAVVGTVSGNNITFGNAYTFNPASTTHVSSAYDSVNKKVVISFSDGGASLHGKSTVGTVSGTAITFGNRRNFFNAAVNYTSTVYDSANGKIVVFFTKASDTKGYANVGTVSGTDITYATGSEPLYNNGATYYPKATYTSSGKVVVTYQDGGNSNYGTARVGTVDTSGADDTVNFGSESVFHSATSDITDCSYDPVNDKVLVVYNEYSSGDGKAIIGTISGTSISFGTAVTFNNTGSNTYMFGIAYDVNNRVFVISFRDTGNSLYGTAVVGTVSGNSISFGSKFVFTQNSADNTNATYISDYGKVAISYKNNSSTYGDTVIFNSVTVTSNLTSENYIGIAAEAISNGATGKITIVGGTNSSQTGLTTAKKYYVQNVGGVDTTISEPEVIAGTSISSTKILVR